MNGTIEQLDVGEICFDGEAQRRWFINIADAGIGALVARRANRTSKAGGGFLTYLAGALREIASFQPFSARVVADGVLLHDGACASIVVCNGAFHGGGMRPAPDASPIDGMLDAVLLKALTRRALAFNVLPRVYFGSHVNHPAVTCVRAQTLRIEADDPIPLALDGENAGAFTRLCVAVVPGVLRVRVPRRLCKV